MRLNGFFHYICSLPKIAKVTKTMRLRILSWSAFSALIALTLVSTGCYEQSRDFGEIKVRVMNADSIPIQNALVRLYAPINNGTSVVNRYRYSEASGEAIFRHDLPAFFDIECGKGGWKGCSYVYFEPGNNKEVVVILKPYGVLDNGCAP
jgi:hypothetical protein